MWILTRRRLHPIHQNSNPTRTFPEACREVEGQGRGSDVDKTERQDIVRRIEDQEKAGAPPKPSVLARASRSGPPMQMGVLRSVLQLSDIFYLSNGEQL